MKPGGLPADIDCYKDFGVSRSFCRGAPSITHVRAVNEELIDLVNKWCRFEKAKGQRPRLSMQDRY